MGEITAGSVSVNAKSCVIGSQLSLLPNSLILLCSIASNAPWLFLGPDGLSNLEVRLQSC